MWLISSPTGGLAFVDAHRLLLLPVRRKLSCSECICVEQSCCASWLVLPHSNCCQVQSSRAALVAPRVALAMTKKLETLLLRAFDLRAICH